MPKIQLRSILAATDLSPASDAVVRSAAALARGLNAELHLLHALGRETLPYSGEGDGEPSYPERVQRVERALAEQLRQIAPDLLPASLWVINRPVPDAILERAAEISADLLVIGPHAGGEVGAHFFGTTAEKVIEKTRRPCLVAVAPLPQPIRKIGVPSDFSGPAQGALDVSLALAASLSEPLDVRLFHVGWRVDRMDNPDLEDTKLRPELEREAREATTRLGISDPPAIHFDVVWDVNPATAIVDYARAEQLDLLVLGTHGYRGLKRLILGSVAAGVARHAPCPVLLVPPRRATDFEEGAPP